MIPQHKKHSLKLIRQSIGTLNKVAQMIENEAYCFDIMQQLQSVSGMNKKALEAILESHLQTCIIKHMSGTDEDKNKGIDEIMKIYKAQ